jgi:hypothetical protein
MTESPPGASQSQNAGFLFGKTELGKNELGTGELPAPSTSREQTLHSPMAEQSTPTTAPQTLPQQATTARATAPAVTTAPLAPHRPNQPPPENPDSPEHRGPPDRTGPSGRTARLRIGWHAIPRSALRQVTAAPSTSAGLLLGRDQQQIPVPLKLFDPSPARLALIGGVWAAQLLIFRAFALGARALVVTTEQRAWSGFGERATGQYHRLTVLGGEPSDLPPGTAQTPSLIVYDLGMTGPVTAPPLGPWSAQLTVLRQLDRPGVPTLQEADLTLIQRLGGDEATSAAAALRLGQQNGHLLQFMTDDMLALIGNGPDQFVQLHQTGVERQILGTPRR